MMTTQKQIRAAFWEQHPGLQPRNSKGEWPTDTRCTFVDFVDHLCRDRQISEALAQRVTL